MKTLIIGLLMLAVSVVLALLLKEDNGYLMLGYGPWTVEGSLAFFLLLDLLLFLFLYLSLRVLVNLWAVPRRVQDWSARRGALRARKSLTQGLVALSEGDWNEAEKRLLRHAEYSETPLLNYLAAARSAQHQGAHERRDHYLHLAHESMPSADIAVSLTQAELQLAHEQLEQALATLMHLRTIAPRHTYVLTLLKELYLRLGDWEQLQRLLPELRKRKVLEKEELRQLERTIYGKRLEIVAGEADADGLMRVWNEIPKGLRSDRDLVTAQARYLLARGRLEQAELLIREALQRHWDETLVELYGRLEGGDANQQLTTAESWLEAYSNDAVLLLALGRLSRRNRLWGKARSYLEAAIGAAPSAEGHRELARLLEQLEEGALALQHYRAGLELSLSAPHTEMPSAGLLIPARARIAADSIPQTPLPAIIDAS